MRRNIRKLCEISVNLFAVLAVICCITVVSLMSKKCHKILGKCHNFVLKYQSFSPQFINKIIDFWIGSPETKK